jgi:hypothetical protein
MTQLNINSVHDHHFLALRDRLRDHSGSASYPLLVCSSYPSVFPNARLSDEIAKLATTFDLSRETVKAMQVDQINHCFCDETTKARIRMTLLEAMQQLNDQVATASESVPMRRKARMKARAAKASMPTMNPMMCVVIVRACVCARVCVCMRACACACVRARLTLMTCSPILYVRRLTGAIGDILSSSSSKTKFVNPMKQLNPMLLLPAAKSANRKLMGKSASKSKMKSGIATLYGDTNCSITDVFAEIDADHNGTLDRDELTAALQKMQIPDGDVDAIVDEMDTDGDGLVSAAEFEEFMDDAFDATDVLECPEEILREVDELEADMAQSTNSVTDAIQHTAELVEMEGKLAEAFCETGVPDLRVIASGASQPGDGSVLRVGITGTVAALASRGETLFHEVPGEPSAPANTLRTVLEAGAQNLNKDMTTEERLQLLKRTGVELWKASKNDGTDVMNLVKRMLKNRASDAISQEQLQRLQRGLAQCELSVQQQEALRGCSLETTGQFSNEHVAILQKVGLTDEQQTVVKELGLAMGTRVLSKFLPGHSGMIISKLLGASSTGGGSATGGGGGLDGLKTMLAQQLMDRVTDADIPPIVGSLDSAGGEFALKNVRIEHFETPAESIEFHLNAAGDGASLHISDLRVRTTPFSWQVDKRKFPKLKDQGMAIIDLDGLGLDVTMGIKEGKNGAPQIHNMRVALHLNDFTITVLEGRHQILYNKVFRLVRFVVRKVRTACSPRRDRAQGDS